MSTKKRSKPEEDDLLPEYDFRSLRVVARGPERPTPPDVTIHLEPDVATAFPDSQSVNEALRLLLKIARQQVKPANT